MGRECGMMGGMFGNMSFDSSDEEQEEEGVADEEGKGGVVENAGGEEVVQAMQGSGVEVGYQPQNGNAILVRQIRERGLSFQLWPASAALCWYLENGYGGGGGGSLGDARVLELGAGTGMAGVMAGRFGARVTLTDLPHVLQNLQSNAELNGDEVKASGGSLDVRALRWGVKGDVAEWGVDPPDLVLASDCVYYDTLFEPLMQTLKWLCGIGEGEKGVVAGGTPVVLLAHLRRWKKDGQFFKMAAKCFNVEIVHKHPLPDNARTGVVVYKFTRRISSR